MSVHISTVDEKSSLLGKMNEPRKICEGIRRISSKGVFVALTLDFLVFGAFFSLFKMSTELHGYVSQRKMQYLPSSVTLLLLTITCPLAGWLADVYFGRYKVMRVGLWLMWIGGLAGSISIVLLSQCDHVHGSMFVILSIVGYFFGFIVFPIGFSAFAVNAVQFGTDQMPEASADEVSAYIHWMVWAIFAGLLVSEITTIIYYCAAIDTSNDYYTPSLQLVLPMTMLSLAVCCDCLFGRWLTIEPESQNPLKTVFGVLKFAATHKRPIGRCAITYCEEVQPCRLDFAKEKFKGPYTTEQVEDVKTFFRIMVVAASTSAFCIPFLLYYFPIYFLGNHFNMGYNYDELHFRAGCIEQSKELGYSVATFAVVVIPLYEFLVYPLTRNRIPSMLKRVGIAAVLTLVLSVATFAMDTIQHALHKDMECMFRATLNVLNPNSVWIAAPSQFLIAVQLVLYTVAILEFTCAQSPYSMRGLLIGLVNSIIFFTYPLGYAVFTAWHHFSPKLPSSPSCDFYYFLFQFLCAVVGLVVLCIVARWYKRRTREDLPCQQALVESIFERGLSPSNATRKQTQYTYLS